METNSKSNVGAVNFNIIAVEEKVSFSPYEMQLVKRTWTYLEDQHELSIQLMVSMLTRFPQLKSKFIFTHGLNTEAELRGNSQLAYHGSRIVAVFDRIVKDIENINSNEYVFLKNLGCNHFGYGVQPEHFKVLTFLQNK
jgi:hemoglobin-like flavoprotein